MQLDKDILCKGNKIYSSETCVFVPQYINMLFVKRDSMRGNLPIGVRFNKSNSDKYVATGRNANNKLIHIGSFDSIDEAFSGYKLFKENIIKEVANKHKEQIPRRLYDAMINYKVEIND